MSIFIIYIVLQNKRQIKLQIKKINSLLIKQDKNKFRLKIKKKIRQNNQKFMILQKNKKFMMEMISKRQCLKFQNKMIIGKINLYYLNFKLKLRN